MSAEPKKFYTSAEVAALLLVSPITVRECARKGLLPSVATLGGHRRFLLGTVREFASAHGIPLEDATAAGAQPLRVMIVDDDPAFASYVREVVRAADPSARVKMAADGFDAGQLSEAHRPQLVIVDINMPRVNGIELCARLRRSPATAEARIVVISGDLTDRNIAAARAAGASAWLDKGAPRAEIAAALGLRRPVPSPEAPAGEPRAVPARKRGRRPKRPR